MSAAVYAQVEDAIARRLHVMVPGGGLFGPGYRYPVGIEHGNIVMRDSDCGLAKPVIVWTTDQWRTHVDESGRGLYKKVGFWSFEAADDPAANDIRLCHQSPGSTGRQLYAMRGEIDRLRAELERERMRLAACGVVALANTPESAKKARDMHPDYRSASCDDVARMVDKQMALRAAVEALVPIVQRDRELIGECDEYRAERDAALRLADEAMGEGK